MYTHTGRTAITLRIEVTYYHVNPTNKINSLYANTFLWVYVLIRNVTYVTDKLVNTRKRKVLHVLYYVTMITST